MIKNKLKIGLVSVFAMVLAMTGFAVASDLTYSADTIVDLTSADFTISSGSTAEGVVVNSDSVVVTMGAGDAFTITSASREITIVGSNSNISVSSSCNSSLLNTVVITSSTGTGSYTLSPAGSQCTYVTGGGGGGGTPADTTPPTSTSISIAAGAATASSASVALTLGATGASYMMISNAADFTGAAWETYATSKAWTLTSGDEVKTVYAKFKDASGNISTAVSDTITLSGTGEEPAAPETP